MKDETKFRYKNISSGHHNGEEFSLLEEDNKIFKFVKEGQRKERERENRKQLDYLR